MSEALYRLPLVRARALAERIAAELAPYCERLEIAGSIRRARPTVGDIDLVCLPRPGQLLPLLRRAALNAKPAKRGDQYVVLALANGVQLDLWIAHAGGIGDDSTLFESEMRRVPSNFGVLLLSRTGSAAHNIWIAQRAQALGLHFNPHRGVMRGRQIVAAAEESEIFAALGLDYVPPERRER